MGGSTVTLFFAVAPIEGAQASSNSVVAKILNCTELLLFRSWLVRRVCVF